MTDLGVIALSLDEFQRIGQAIGAWVPLLLLVGAVIGFFILRKYQLQRIALETQQYLSELTLNVKVTPRVFEEDGEWFLEANVDVSNASSKTWCIPAVYVSARALVDRKGTENYEGKTDFDDLPECSRLSTPLNRAYLPNTIYQVGPGETELFVRWDKLNSDFVQRFPVVVISVEVFGAAKQFLGEWLVPASMRDRYMLKKGKYILKRGNDRKRWLEFMAKRVERSDFSIMFARWRTLGYEVGDPFDPGERYLQVSQGGTHVPDLESSAEFRGLLNTVVQWSRQTTVDVVGAAKRKEIEVVS